MLPLNWEGEQKIGWGKNFKEFECCHIEECFIFY